MRYLIALVLVLSFQAQAQQPIPKPASMTEQSGETEEQTLLKCIQDLSSADRDLRLRSVMVMAKYDHQLATDGIYKALHDKDEQVRHSAVVAVMESSRMMQNPKTAMALIMMLNDSNVHTRRTVSTFAGTLAIFAPMSQSAVRTQRGRLSLPPPAVRVILGAFGDKDLTVRRNMLGHMSTLRTSIPEIQADLIRPLLRDQDAEVRLIALRESVNLTMMMDDLLPHILHLAKDQSVMVRRLLATSLGNRRVRAATKLLQRMVEDPDEEVALRARVALFNLGQKDQVEPLINALMAPTVAVKHASEDIIHSLANDNKNGRTYLKSVMASKDAKTRLLALKRYRRTKLDQPEDLALLWQTLEDPFKPIREEAVSALPIAYQHNRLPPEQLKAKLMELLSSRHPEIRRATLNLEPYLPKPTDKAEILAELMLDDVASLRAEALSRIIRNRHTEDWMEIALLALTDEDKYVVDRIKRTIARLRKPFRATVLQAIVADPPTQDLGKWASEQLNPPRPQPAGLSRNQPL